ncbi:hypothetical protein, partial [Mesorhizobium sp. M7D.F.Ca.US.004.01.2.1]|uniref:hypothetical protein n=1 Tax=Mesorhizobium sp. M7D.F.Ca.US.004.01.2.1 TaxID=2496738 RepID=UPI0019D27AFE
MPISWAAPSDAPGWTALIAYGLWSAAELALKASHQFIKLLVINGGELGRWMAHRARLNDAAPTQNVLANGEAETELLLVAQERQIDVEHVLSSF